MKSILQELFVHGAAKLEDKYCNRGSANEMSSLWDFVNN
jgi:hypothetical protein